MLEVTSQDISKLNDTDLRLLIGYLCEAEVSSIGLSAQGVTYGGHQNAKDGGIDVRVNYDIESWKQGFIPRKNTGFQVKKPKMPASEIPKEMAPKGILRESIKNLVALNGAYIIISSQSSTADGALIDRKKAMRKVIDDYIPQAEVILDFYDSQRIATWVNTYPSLTTWVRKRVGRDIEGWKGYENWAYCPMGIDEEYILDENVRLSVKGHNAQSISIEDGLNKLRLELGNPKSVIRLVGLSGVGKTRFVQALFDERVGNNALEKSLVLYTDIGDNQNPSPKQMLEQLILKNSKVYLIVDNCPPELHKQLTSILKVASTDKISLMTIEYDVKDETKEETEVYHLENASENVISQLILERYEYIDSGSSWHIAKLSGGNFRIAIALASVVNRGENISTLPDKTIFSRLFKQRNGENNNLEVVAEVCSLVYSFNIDTTSSENMEIKLLSDLAGMSVKEFLRNVVELESRDLIQKRGVYRAFLPHALANRLAVNALENIPFYELREVFENKAEWRLYRSFTKRISYLHFSEKAKQFAEEWIEKSELLKDFSTMDEKKMHLLECVAPLNIELTMKTLEKINQKEYAEYFYSRENPEYSRLCRLLVHLAYDSQYFSRSVLLLIKMTLKERENENVNSIRDSLKKLFHLYLSHTHASLEQRLKIIEHLLLSKNEKEQVLGLVLLDELMEARNFSSYGLSDFGGHIRDLGYNPKLGSEIEQWYRGVTEFCLEKHSIESISDEISTILANNLRSLWSQRYCFNIVENVCLIMHKRGLWIEGWISIKSILKYDGKRMARNLIDRLTILEENLRPKSLEERLQIFLNSKRLYIELFHVFEENENATVDETNNKIISQINILGEYLSKEKSILIKYLPDLLENENIYLKKIGEIVGGSYYNQKELWTLIKGNLGLIDIKAGDKPFLIGILSEFSTELITEVFTDLIESNYMNSIISLQDYLFGNSEGIDRLIQLINDKSIPQNYIFSLRSLSFNDEIKPEKFLEFLKAIRNSYGDFDIIAHFLFGLIFSKKEEFLVYESTIEMMHEALMNIFSKEIKSRLYESYNYSEIIMYVYSLPNSTDKFIELLSLILDGISCHRIYEFDVEEILEALAIVNPKKFLEQTYKGYLKSDLLFRSHVRTDRLSSIDEELLIDWIKEKQYNEQFNRVKMLLENLKLYRKTDNKYSWSKLGLYILNHFYKNEIILNHIESNLFSLSSLGVFSESIASIFEERRSLISELFHDEKQELSSWAQRVNAEQVRRIEQFRKEELEEDRGMQYFEY